MLLTKLQSGLIYKIIIGLFEKLTNIFNIQLINVIFTQITFYRVLTVFNFRLGRVYLSLLSSTYQLIANAKSYYILFTKDCGSDAFISA